MGERRIHYNNVVQMCKSEFAKVACLTLGPLSSFVGTSVTLDVHGFFGNHYKHTFERNVTFWIITL